MADNEWKKLSNEEKVEHKNWKARQEGYEECIKLFQRADDPVFSFSFFTNNNYEYI
jgi:hypothetical protein